MFFTNKYSKWYYSIIETAKSQHRKKLLKEDLDYKYYENHHIIPKALGGSNSNENLVLLTAREHFICHILLPKMCVSEKHRQQMLNALRYISKKSPNQFEHYCNARLYEYAKKHIKCLPERREKHKNRVTCKNRITGEFLQVSKDVFDNDPNLVGLNYGKILSEDRRKSHSEKMKGSNNPFFGKTHSQETIRKANIKRSQTQKGRPKSDEWKQKMRDSWKRRKEVSQ